MRIQILRTSVLLLQVLLLSGCATQALWSEKQAYQYAPASNANLELLLSRERADVMVRYDERQKNDSIRRRAYFLEPNLARVDAGRKPHFVESPITNGMVAIKQNSRGGVGRKKVTWLRPPGFAKLSTFGSGGS